MSKLSRKWDWNAMQRNWSWPVFLWLLLGIVLMAYFVTAPVQHAPAAAQPEKTPVSQRSLETVDRVCGFGQPDVYLIRARSCYYLVKGDTKPVILHLEDCPNPVHQGKK